MSVKTFSTTLAIFCVIFGLFEILAPHKFLSMLGERDSASDLLIYSIRELGILYLALGIIFWYAKDAPPSTMRDGLFKGLAVGALGVTALFISEFSHGIYDNTVGYLFAVLFFIVGLLAIYLLRKGKEN